MATIVIDSKTIEKTAEVATRYRRRDLIDQKRMLKLEIDRINEMKSTLQGQIDVINALIAEMDILNVTDEG
jgi:hypothetical protein